MLLNFVSLKEEDYIFLTKGLQSKNCHTIQCFAVYLNARKRLSWVQVLEDALLLAGNRTSKLLTVSQLQFVYFWGAPLLCVWADSCNRCSTRCLSCLHWGVHCQCNPVHLGLPSQSLPKAGIGLGNLTRGCSTLCLRCFLLQSSTAAATTLSVPRCLCHTASLSLMHWRRTTSAVIIPPHQYKSFTKT